jgi:WD40 repeat protein/class 3 adenylate cyclase
MSRSDTRREPHRSSTEILTFLIADVRGYTRFTRERGDAAAATLAKKFADFCRDAVEARGGRVLELRGDEALAVFESPAQAVRAALEFQATCAEESRSDPDFPLPVGIGIDSGEAVPVEEGYRGRALNMAARLCSGAAAGEVLVTREVADEADLSPTEAVFVERGPRSFKGFEDDVDVIEASFEGTPLADTFPERTPDEAMLPPELDPLTPLVDREHEMRWLRGTWRSVRRGRGRVLFVSGPAQIGKTRLAAEIAAHVRAEGGSVRYAGPGGAGTAMALAALREASASALPTLLVLDDIDVAGPPVADAIAEARSDVEGRPLMVLGFLRSVDASPALAELVHGVDERGDGHRALAPLDTDGVRDIVRLYVGDAFPDVPLESMVRSSEGVPGRVHEVASDWARSEATRRLEAAAEYLAEGRRLRATDLEFANNVIGLKLGRLYTVDGRDPRREVGDLCPYKGLASFEENDWASFFGRERLVGELAARTVQVGVLGVVGASGSGKSSLVAAGLLPSLGAGLLPGSDRWIQAVMRPGDHPMGALASALTVVDPAIEDAEDPLAAAVHTIEQDGRLVLVIDQFEETFTLCESDAERAGFIASLVGAARVFPDRCVVVLTIRSDYYGHAAPYPDLAEVLAENHVLIGPMSRDELRRAIELPGRRVGLRVEEALVDALVDEVEDEPGGLPLLSTALVELWQAREDGWIRMDAHEATGGVKGAVARLAETAYEQLTDVEREAVRRIMLRIVVSDGETVTRRRASLDEFDPERDAVGQRVIMQFARDRLLTVGEGTVEIAHEALLREWPRLRRWLEEDQQGRQVRQQLGEAARHWGNVDRDPSELFRGARLSATLDWATTHAGELNELERDFLADARRASEQDAERQRRTNRRLRGLLVGVALFLVLALIAGGLALVQRGKARASADAAEARRLGAQAVTEDELDLSLLLAAQGRALEDSIDTRSTLLASLLKAPGAIGVLPGTGDRVLRILSSADRRTFVATDNIGGVAVYDAESLALRRIVRLPDAAALALRPDGAAAVGALFNPQANRPELAFLDLTTGDVRLTPQEGGEVICCDAVVYAADGRSFVTLEDRGHGPTWVRYDPAGRQLEAEPADVPLEEEAALTLTPDGSRIVFESAGHLAFFDTRTFRRDRVDVDASFAYGVSPDGRSLAYGTEDGRLVLVDLATGEHRDALGRHTAAITGVGFSPDGRTIVSTGDDRDVFVWEAASGELREILHGHAGRVFGPTFDATGDTAFTVGLDGKVIAWDLTGERRLAERSTWAGNADLDPGGDLTLAVSPDGSSIAMRASDDDVVVLDAGSPEPRWRRDPWSQKRFERLVSQQPESYRPFVTAAISSVAFSPDGSTLAVSGEHQEVVLYDATDGTELRRWSASRVGWVNGLSFAPDGDLVTSADDGRVTIWDPSTGRAIRRMQVTPFYADGDAYDGAAVSAMVSPDGHRLAVTTFKRNDSYFLRVIDLVSGKELWGGKRTDLWYSVAAWSPDSTTIATGGFQSGDLLLWDAATGRRLGEPVRASAGFVQSVGFAWDGALVVTGATDGTVRLFDTATHKQVGSNLPGVDNMGTWASVLPGDRLLALVQNGDAFTWDLDPGRWSAQACRVANRALTRSEWRAFLPDRPYQPACGR